VLRRGLAYGLHEPSLQRVDLPAERADPVLLQNVDGFLGLVHSQDDDGLAAFPPPQEGIEVDHVDLGRFQGLEHSQEAARMVRHFHGYDVGLHHGVAVAAQDVDGLGRVIGDESDGARLVGLGYRDGPDVDPFDSQALADVHETTRDVLEAD
jgi:hypothetical protein